MLTGGAYICKHIANALHIGTKMIRGMRSKPGELASLKWILIGMLREVHMSLENLGQHRGGACLLVLWLENHMLLLGVLYISRCCSSLCFPLCDLCVTDGCVSVSKACVNDHVLGLRLGACLMQLLNKHALLD